MMDLQGQFLIAMPQLEDYFQNTVVYMCEHNEQGSMGLVINQPTDLSIAELYSKMNFMMKNDRTFSEEYCNNRKKCMRTVKIYYLSCKKSSKIYRILLNVCNID